MAGEKLAPTFKYVSTTKDLNGVGTPASGEVWIGVDSSGNAASKDSTGTVTNLESGGGGGSGLTEGSEVTNADSPFTATAGTRYDLNGSGGNVTVDLPGTPSDTDRVEFTTLQMGGSTNATIRPNGNTIQASSSNIVLEDNRWTVRLRWDASANSGNGTWVSERIGQDVPDAFTSGTGTSDIYGSQYGTTLTGSSDLSNPQTGLHTEISTAISNNNVFINITGAWQMGSGVSFDSSRDTPSGNTPIRRLPIVIDARGAAIKYDGSGYCLTNDCTGNISGQIAGGRFILKGGIWAASGSPDGFVKLKENAFAELLPQTTRDFSGAAGGSAIYGLAVNSTSTKWNESNVFGGQHQNVDSGIVDNIEGNSDGISYQDNYGWNLQFGQLSNYGFDLTGNWIDCQFDNTTIIADTDGAAGIRYNGNLDGSTWYNMEVEDAASSLNNFYLVEVDSGAAARGPFLHHCKNDFQAGNALQRVSVASSPGTWNVRLEETDAGAWHFYHFQDGTDQRLQFDRTNFSRQENTGSLSSPTWSTQGSI